MQGGISRYVGLYSLLLFIEKNVVCHMINISCISLFTNWYVF